MIDSIALLLILVGIVILAAQVFRARLEQLSLPAVLAYILLGVGLNLLNHNWAILRPEIAESFHFLAEVGIVVLLFRVGLESDLLALLRQLRSASVVWIGNVGLSGALGFVCAYWLLGLNLIPSLFAAVALSATSVGITAAVWRDAGALDSENGALLIDVAELDDISAIILMALLFTLAPAIYAGTSNGFLLTLGMTAGFLVLKFIGFVLFCYLFSQYLEQRITVWSKQHLSSYAVVILVTTAIVFIIAGLASWMGFSLAVGAMFAGLAYSRDPEEYRIDNGFELIYQFFAPFFFVGIGLAIDLTVISSAIGLGLALLVVAVLGKFIGTGLPALLIADRSAALLLGISMIPRAEIAMIIMQHGRSLGDWAVSSELFGAFVIITLVTCLFIPILVTRLLQMFPQTTRQTRNLQGVSVI